MDNSRFSSLIYRIIGKPDRWHDDYIDVMHQILDETESFDDPDNFSELAIGDQILSRISESNEALSAFNALLNKSRFKMIILDQEFKPIYHNQNAKELHARLINPNSIDSDHSPDKGSAIELKPTLLETLKNLELNNANLIALNYKDENDDQLYLREIQNQAGLTGTEQSFHLLLALDQEKEKNQLQSNLINEYSLTDKEKSVLMRLVHGKNLKQIATEMFISDNTVRTHTKALFRKTNTNSQTDLVRLVLTHESQVLDSYFDSGASFIANNAPQLEEKFVVIPSGHKIYYRDYGPKDGEPIIVCHNGFGCRVSIPHNYEEVCNKTGKRIIIPDRPGYGLTPFIEDHPNNWLAHLNEFIDTLQLDSFEMLGNIFGSAIAMAFAEQADERLKRVILTSPVFVNSKKDSKYLTGILAPSVRLVKASKKFAREIYELWLKSVTMNLNNHYRKMLKSSVGDNERELFEQHDVFDLMVDGFKQGASSGLDGISHEMVYCISARNLDLKKITMPVSVWWGSQDNRISLEGVKNIAKKLPNAELNIRQGYSEHIYYALFEEIIG